LTVNENSGNGLVDRFGMTNTDPSQIAERFMDKEESDFKKARINETGIC